MGDVVVCNLGVAVWDHCSLTTAREERACLVMVRRYLGRGRSSLAREMARALITHLKGDLRERESQ